MKMIRKILAVLLTIATLIGIFSCGTSVFAEEYNEYAENKAYQENLLTETIEAEKEQAEIICEVPEKRDEFSKTYKRADGSFTTVISESPIHKLKDGEWEEIDNSLKSDGDVIYNTNGSFEIEFPEEISENEKINISNGDESISFSVNDIEKSSATIEKNETTEDLIQEDLNKTISQITYENIRENTDIQYIVSSNSIKENIIVSNKESLKEEYSFEIEKGDLKAEFDNENNIVFKNNKNQTIFTIPAPVMTDAENAVSYDIDVEIKNQDNSVLTLIYTPSKEWLESDDRAYPVVIDPVFLVGGQNGDFFEDTVIMNDSNNPDSRETNYVDDYGGYISNDSQTKSEVLVKYNIDFFDFLKLDNISVTSVNTYFTGAVNQSNLLAKEVNGSYDINTVTYNDVYPADNSAPLITYGETIDYYTGSSPEIADEEITGVCFDITEKFLSWLNGEENNGFAIVPQNSETKAALILNGYAYNNKGEIVLRTEAFCLIDYVDTSGSNDSYEYLTQEIGRAGTASVNTFTRSLSLSRSDLSMDGLRMPVDISFNYNSAFDNWVKLYNNIADLYEEEGITLPYGNKWLPSYCRYIFTMDDCQYLFYTGEGTVVDFYLKEETVGEGDEETTEIIFEEDETSDSGYTLELINQENDVSFENFKITNSNGETEYFNDMGLVTEIREDEPNSDGTYDKISIAYDEENPFIIDYVTDGIGRKYDFIYNSETSLLSEIKCLNADGEPIKAGTTTGELMAMYSYNSDGDLIRVTCPDDEIVHYSYNNGNLYRVKNIDGYKVQYSYDSLGKVTNIDEYTGNIKGNTITLTQLSSRQVKVVDGYNGTETYQFGKDGKLNYTFDDRGNYLKSDYAPANDENVYSSNDWSISSQNLLKNGSFEETENGKAKEWDNPFSVEDINTSETETDYACKILSTEETCALQSQSVDVNGGNAYTFSFFAKANEDTETGKLYAKIIIEDSEKNGETIYRQFSVTEDFKQYSITIRKDIISEISKVTVAFGSENQSGHFYVNNAQLEKGLGTAEYNLIENGGFTNNGEHWSDSIIVTDSINGEAVNVVKLCGGLPSYNETILEDHISATTQNVEINGKKGDTYSIGGWFKGCFDDDSIYSDLNTKFDALIEPPVATTAAQLKVTYSYTDTVTETAEDGTTTTTEQTLTENFVVDFAPHNDGWQYATDTFALKGDTETVDVTVMAKNIPADSYATGISLEQDLESELIEEYEDAEESDDTEEFCSCGCEECYYGENCPCTGAVNDKCQCPECLREETSTQDNFGNTLSNKSTDGISYIETLSSYTEDGNNLKTYTDENGNVVTYDYDILNGILKSVTNPIGTENETTTTSYTYDAMGKVVSVSTTVSDSQNQSLQYVYTMDRLTEIITLNGKYRIIYDDWGQVSSVNVITTVDDTETVTPLVEYTYNEGAKRTQVKTATYKNSSEKIASYRYEYYDNGTLKKVFLNEVQIHFIEYDNLGVLTSIQNTGGRTVEYTEDGTYIYNAAGTCVYSTLTNDDGSVTEENLGVTYKTFAPESDYDSASGVSTETDKIEINSINRITQETNADYFGRTNSQNLSVYNITDESDENPATLIGRINTEYEYSNKEDGKTSSSIEKFINKTYNGDSKSYRVYDGYYYEYDKQNKISSEKTLNADGTTTDKYSYEYDKLGQLVRFNDAVENKTYTYTYDNNGNILTKSEYAYTTGDLGTATNTTNYSYETQWKDRLSTVGDKTITYDNIGNPISYLGATLTWEGRQLKSYENDEKLVTYEYDENGMRYRTTVVDKTAEEETVVNIDYVWLGEKLVSIVISDDETYLFAKYLYNSSGEVIGFKWVNDTAAQSTYYYLKNLQGDITGVVSATGKMQVSYSYDVFGKMSTQYHYNTSSLTWFEEMYNQIHISALNPFGYRGYCFDGYTEFYYLQSRYYDPNTGRFINADDTDYLDATGTVLGCNLFAYCENDPVNRVDVNGNSPIQWICAVIGGVAGWFFGDYIARNCGFTSSSKSKKIVAKYWTIRIAVTAGTAAIGYLVGTAIVKLVTRFLIKNPTYIIKIINKIGINNSTRIMNILGINPLKYLNPGTLVSMLKNRFITNNPASIAFVKLLYDACNYLGISISIDTGHAGTAWNSYHMHIGSSRVHVAILKAAYTWLKSRGIK